MSRAKVLAVDDEKDFLKFLVRRLSARNLDVNSVTSGQDALRYLAENDIDVVVLDMKMPGMDGLQTLTEIRKRHPGVEVIMLTGHGSMSSGLEGMRLGAYDFVLKPFSIDDLLERILSAHERVRLRTGNGASA